MVLFLGLMTVAAILAALWRGAARERIAAGALAGLWLVSPALAPGGYGRLIADLGLTTLMSLLAWRSPRFWPAPAAGLALMQVALDLAFALRRDTTPSAFLTAQGLVFGGLLLCVALGVRERIN